MSKTLIINILLIGFMGIVSGQDISQTSEENLKWGNDANGIKMAIVLQKDTLLLGKSSSLNLFVKNNSSKQVKFEETSIEWDFAFLIKDNSGNLLPLKCKGKPSVLWKCSTIMLDSNKIYRCSGDIEDVCDFKKAGTYTIQVSRKFSFDGKEEFEVKSNIVTLTVKDDAPKETGASGKEAGAKKSE